MYLIDRTSVGHMLAVNASGKIAAYQAFLGSALILTLPIAWLFLYCNFGIYSVGWAMIATIMACAWGRVGFARKIVGLSARKWFFGILIPLVLLFAISAAVGYLPHFIMPSSFLRVVVTTIVTEMALLPLAWFLLLGSERQYVAARFATLKARFLK